MSAFDRAPVYLCSRSADVILSDIRPMKLKLDALKSINVLFDELLWLVLTAAQSLSTDKLKNGLLKILPTPLGKEALLEAEVELRAYLEKDPLNAALYANDSTLNEEKFSINHAFELMRIKCEAYSTLNDSKENADNGKYGRIEQLNQVLGFPATMVAPAALYLTAILESICERVLSNISRVTARDSSRTTATIDDLYVALCEDESIYNLFKSMKVYDQIKFSTQSLQPRRKKSISLSGHSLSSSRGLSPTSEVVGLKESNLLPGNNTRMSSESSSLDLQPSGWSVGHENLRPSAEESTSIRQRSASVLSDLNKRKLDPLEETPQIKPLIFEEETSRDFDDMMRSGSTMKVTLTPDRLKTFEMYAKEKPQPRRTPFSSASLTIRSDTNAASQLSNNVTEDIDKVVANSNDPSRDRSRRVDSNSESEQNVVRGPPRKMSLSSSQFPVTHSSVPAQHSRLRSASAAQHPGTLPHLKRKASMSNSLVSRTDLTTQKEPTLKTKSLGNVIYGTQLISSELSKLDLELNDVFDVDSEEYSSSRKASPFTPKSARSSGNGVGDLVDFLKEGPPRPPDTMSVTTSNVDNKSKPGRLRNMVSKLTRGSSTEKSAIRVNSDEQLNRSRGPIMTPLTAKYNPPPISIKKYLQNVPEIAQSGIITQTLPISPQSSPSLDDHPLRMKDSVLLAEHDSEVLPQNDSSLTHRKKMNQTYEDHQKLEESPAITTANIPDQYSQRSTTPVVPKAHINDISSSTRFLPGRLRERIEDIRGAISNASTVDECRLLFDFYLTAQESQSEIPTSISSTMSHGIGDIYESSLAEILLSTAG